MGQSVSHGATLRPSELPPSYGKLPASSPSSAFSLEPPPECPMHAGSSPPGASRNALQALQAQLENNMPDLPQTRSSDQVTQLDVERTTSSIPRRAEQRQQLPGSQNERTGEACPVAGPSTGMIDPGRNWVYPSPQQFHNALVRKGKEAPEESVAMMVNIHNWLNESAWLEIRRWEETITGGEMPELSSFKGRPQDLSPKARWHLMLGRLFPDRYNTEPPFDRHDWSIWRPREQKTQRYVIDYYSAPDDEQGLPVFNLDVRPAIDSPSAVYWRLRRWYSDKTSSQ